MEVIKRDGRKKKFDITKISKAIMSAFKSTDVIPTDEQLNSLLQSILKKLGNRESVSVEEIQDIVEEILMGNYPKVAKNYILYRDERTKQRKKKDAITKVYLAQLEGKVNEKQNANVDELSFGGRKGEASSTQNKDYALDYYMSPKMAKNHRNNRIYIHDLDSYIVGMHNCVEENMWINILTDGKPRTLKIKDFVKELDFKVGELSLDNRNIQILSRDGYTSLLNIWGRKTNTNESVYTLKTKVGLPLKLTGEHRVPVLRNGKEDLVYVKDLQIGDELLSSCCSLSKGISKNYGTSKIIEITQTYEDTYVYDFETKSHWFITNNFVVHNCLSVPFDNLLRDGFTVKQTDIRPANSIGTAFQLLAVIFQIQSLQQFGGVSATHLDWTMVPYVRKSFYKYFKEGLKYVENKNEKQIEKITKKILEK